MSKGKTEIVLTSKKEIVRKRKSDSAIKTKAIFAVLIMVASVLIVSGSAWGKHQQQPTPKLKLRWKIGDVETSKEESPWDEFGNFKAPKYTRKFTVGQPDCKFPKRTGPYCQGRPNKIDIKFTQKLWEGGKFIFRYSPGYTGCEKIKIYVDGELLKTFTDAGGHNSNQYCTHKMVKHTVVIPKYKFECEEHTITILHAGGDGALWDWLKLKTYEPPCEPKPSCCDHCDDCDDCDDDDCDDDDECEKKCKKSKKYCNHKHSKKCEKKKGCRHKHSKKCDIPKITKKPKECYNKPTYCPKPTRRPLRRPTQRLYNGPIVKNNNNNVQNSNIEINGDGNTVTVTQTSTQSNSNSGWNGMNSGQQSSYSGYRSYGYRRGWR